MQGIAVWAAMGGYAAFVWPAYAIATLVLGGLAIYAWRRYRRSLDRLARVQRGNPE